MLRFIIMLSFAHLSFSALDQEIDGMFNELPLEDFIKRFNEMDHSWKMTNYKHMNKSHLACAFLDNTRDLPVIKHDVMHNLPKNFDAREKWPNCKSIAKVYDQGGCGSCWAFGTAGTASDRTCIQNNLLVILSEQDLDCCKNHTYGINVCDGGDPVKAFECWINLGLVSQECRPYDVEALTDPTKTCQKTCKNSKVYKADKIYGDRVLRVAKDDENIKTELFNRGSVEAMFVVYKDLTLYKGGIYEHKFGKKLDWHSVRVIGYGEENGVPYWLVVNSWGTWWGEKGLFRTKRFQPDLFFEDYMLSADSKIK